MRSLVQALRDTAVADRLGVPAEAVREEKAERAEEALSAGISRRQLFQGAAVAAVTLALPRFARAGGAPRIAIVGAGVSGLNAALTLSDAGYASTVYESSGRIGGRMYSNTSGYWTDGQISEWGGELVDTRHKTIFQLAQRFNIPMDDVIGAQPNGAEDTYSFLGKYYPKKQADADFQNIWQAVKKDSQDAPFPTTFDSSTAAGRALDSMSIYDWIESRVPGGHKSPLGAFLDVAYNIEYGAETTDQSALNLINMLAFNNGSGSFNVFGASDERFHVRGGNQGIPLAIAKALGPSVNLGWRMTAIAKQSDGTYKLSFDTGSGAKEVAADLVILTLPFAVLRDLDYSKAGFDAQKVKAIQELGRGRNGKLQLQFDTRFWSSTGPWPGISNGQSFSDTGYQLAWEVSRAQAGKSGILNNYTGGNTTLGMSTKVPWATVSDKNVQADAQRFLKQLDPVYPGAAARWNNKATSSIPHLDSNFKLAYSYYKVGQCQTVCGSEKLRQGNVFFAGEHTSVNFQGFMEGGAAEGARAAQEILAQLKR